MIFIGILLLASVEATLPGIEFGFTSHALNELESALLYTLITSFQNVTISEPFSMETINNMYDLSLVLSDIKIISLDADMADTRFVFNPNQTITGYFSNLSADADFNWKLDGTIGNGEGKGNYKMSSLNFTTTFNITENKGKPKVMVDTMGLKISGLSVHLSDCEYADHFNWFFDLLSPRIKLFSQDAYPPLLIKMLNEELDSYFGEFSTVTSLGDGIYLDYSFTSDPEIDPSFIEFFMRGEFTYESKRSKYPEPNLLPEFDTESAQLQMAISSYSVNTAVNSAAMAGLLDYTIKQSNLPPSTPVSLNTTSLEFVFPGLVETFGPDLPCDLNFTTIPGTPNITIHNDYQGKLSQYCVVYVENEGVAVELLLGFDFELELSLEDWSIKIKIKRLLIDDVEIIKNNLKEELSPETIKLTLDALLITLVPTINMLVLSNPFPLPDVPYVNLTSTTIEPKDGYILALTSPTLVIPNDEE